MQRINKSYGLPFTFECAVIFGLLFLFAMLITLAGQNNNTSLVPHHTSNTHIGRGSISSPSSPSHATNRLSSGVAQVTTSPPPLATEVPYSPSYVSLASQDASAAGINPNLFVRQIEQESGFNPDAVSSAGAVGIAQFMPATAAQVGINPYDPVQSLHAAAWYMAGLSNIYGGDYAKALAAYNAGTGNVDHAVSMGGSNWVAYLPAETQNYINVILYS